MSADVTALNPSACRFDGIHSWKPNETKPMLSPMSRTTTVLLRKGICRS
jgi:hypothetical protein